MRVLFATAELSPIAVVGGLASAAAGLVNQLRREGVEVAVVMPDYGGIDLAGERTFELSVPSWAGPATVRVGVHPVAGELHVVRLPGMERPHPYLQPDGNGWPDNDRRFLAFSVAVAALWREAGADVLHLNDWHTAAALAALEPGPPCVLSIHNLAYQGTTVGSWLGLLGPRAGAYEWYGATNPFKGGLALADAIVAVSPNYADEIRGPEHGCGLHDLLQWRGDALVGIRNGIDTEIWDPASDPHLPRPFGVDDLAGKHGDRAELLNELGFGDGPGPLAIMVTRLTHQKGTDLVAGLVPFFERMPLRLAVLGSGDASTAMRLREVAHRYPANVAFVEGYDEGLSHRLFGGGDLLFMPSRFEPCGLTQMQAMRYGTLPVVTDLGGLRDTVADVDAQPASGTGWRAIDVRAEALVDALHRAVRGWTNRARRAAMQRRGMSTDWSWREPALTHLALYHQVMRRG